MATKFETIGVQYQQESLTKEEARKNFQWSCRCCCNRGMKIDCDRCAIAAVHHQTIALLDDLSRMGQGKKACTKCAIKNGINRPRT